MFIVLLLLSSLNLAACESLSEKIYTDVIPRDIECYMGADLGAYSDFGIFQINDKKPQLLFSLGTETKTINDIYQVVNDVKKHAMSNYAITINHACISAPEVATEERNFASVHGWFDIKSKKLIKKCDLKTALIVNDLAVVGYGIDFVDQDKIIKIYGETPKERGIRAVVGGKTGLCSSLILWDAKKCAYIPEPGEAGLLEFSPTNALEYELTNHIKQMWDSRAVYWAAFASGSGIRRIYSMLKLKDQYKDSLNLDVHDSEVIFTHPDDELCKATLDLFIKLYGRFARNYAFTVLPYGGLYLVSGLIFNNVDFFIERFPAAHSDTTVGLQGILKRIPVYMITDDSVSLYGAVQCLLLELQEGNESKSEI